MSSNFKICKRKEDSCPVACYTFPSDENFKIVAAQNSIEIMSLRPGKSPAKPHVSLDDQNQQLLRAVSNELQSYAGPMATKLRAKYSPHDLLNNDGIILKMEMQKMMNTITRPQLFPVSKEEYANEHGTRGTGSQFSL